MDKKYSNHTARTKNAIKFARDNAIRYQSEAIGPEHILLGIIEECDGTAFRLLRKCGVATGLLRNALSDRLNEEPNVEDSKIKGVGQYANLDEFTPAAIRVLDLAERYSDKYDHQVVGTEHLFFALTHADNHPVIHQILEGIGAKSEHLITSLKERLGIEEKESTQFRLLYAEGLISQEGTYGFYVKAGVETTDARIEELLRDHFKENEVGHFGNFEALKKELEKIDVNFGKLLVRYHPKTEMRERGMGGGSDDYDAFIDIFPLGSIDEKVLSTLEEYTPHPILDFSKEL